MGGGRKRGILSFSILKENIRVEGVIHRGIKKEFQMYRIQIWYLMMGKLTVLQIFIHPLHSMVWLKMGREVEGTLLKRVLQQFGENRVPLSVEDTEQV